VSVIHSLPAHVKTFKTQKQQPIQGHATAVSLVDSSTGIGNYTKYSLLQQFTNAPSEPIKVETELPQV